MFLEPHLNTAALKRPGKVSTAGRSSRVRTLCLIVSFALLLSLICVFIYTHSAAQGGAESTFYGEVLNPKALAYDFQLIDQNGEPFRLSQARGKVVLLSFGYTHCPDVCPTTLSDLAQIYQSLPEKERSKVEILFVSVDPDRDKPEAMKRYMPYFDPSFTGLTGSPDRINETATAYGVAYRTVQPKGDKPGVYYVNHSPFTYLITPAGELRLRYLYTQLQYGDKVRADIEKCLNSNS
jgi:protein SCO1